MHCKKCDVKIDDYRAHLGYSECTDCSTVVKYSAHTVYPHKTGGYIQPVSSEQADNLKKLDRRSTGSGKVARGQWASSSWDRWLKEYLKEKHNPKPKRTVSYVYETERTIMTNTELRDIVNEVYNSRGYDQACKELQSLYSDDKITLMQKSSYVNQLTNLQMLSKKVRKTVALR